MTILELENVHSYYGKSHILFDLSFHIDKGEVVGLIGRNGAGKSTTLKSIIGIVPPRGGEVRFNGENIARQPSFKIARKGLGYVPEDRRVFSDLTVYENLEIMTTLTKGRSSKWTIERVFDTFPRLGDLRGMSGLGLSGGEQQMLTIARSLMADPELLLLDEPTEGLAPMIIQEIQKLIRSLRQDVTILLAEQNLTFVLGLIDRGLIIDQGRIVYSGTPEELRNNAEIKEKYLGI